MIVPYKHHNRRFTYSRGGPPCSALTITLDDEFVAELDSMISQRGYQNRSEAIRDLARAGMRQAAEGSRETGD